VHLGYGTSIWFRPVSTLVDITCNTFYKCTATFRTQIWRKCWRITLTLILLTWSIGWAPNNASIWQMGFNLAFEGLNEFRPVLTLVDITSKTFCTCTANFRTHCIIRADCGPLLTGTDAYAKWKWFSTSVFSDIWLKYEEIKTGTLPSFGGVASYIADSICQAVTEELLGFMA
jgi:hypothetical protein